MKLVAMKPELIVSVQHIHRALRDHLVHLVSITLHDVRFAVDSVYERACKIIRFVIFVGFALVGSSFNPGGKEHNNTVDTPQPMGPVSHAV